MVSRTAGELARRGGTLALRSSSDAGVLPRFGEREPKLMHALFAIVKPFAWAGEGGAWSPCMSTPCSFSPDGLCSAGGAGCVFGTPVAAVPHVGKMGWI